MKEISQDELLFNINKAKIEIVKQGLVKKILLTQLPTFISLLGPDIDVQSDMHLRVSRPNIENDFVDWHRDTFYGNSYWELNLWMPLFPLAEGAGLKIIEGSHAISSKNVRAVKDSNSFRNQVSQGSLANKIGYPYEPKIDDLIANYDPKRIKLLSPQLGEAILFFGYIAHRAQNTSFKTRISIDCRVKSMLAPTNVKKEYYQPLCRGVVTTCVEKMILCNQ